MRHDPQLAEVIIAVRQYLGSRMAIEHGRLLEALEERNPAKAEEAMLKHFDRMMGEVEEYRRQQSTKATSESAASGDMPPARSFGERSWEG